MPAPPWQRCPLLISGGHGARSRAAAQHAAHALAPVEADWAGTFKLVPGAVYIVVCVYGDAAGKWTFHV